MTPPPSPPALWLVRHAAPLIAAGHCYGRLDLAADAAATAQAAQALAAALPAGCAVWTSPLQRCTQLAQALVALRPDLALAAPDARLQEMDFGRWEGLAWDAVERSALDAWAADLAGHAPGGGEPLRQMLARVQAALAQAWQNSGAGQRPLAWICHAGVARCVQWLALHPGERPTSARWRLPAPALGQWLCLDWAVLAAATDPAALPR